MQSVAQAWLVLELTNSPFRLGLVGTLQFAPMLVLSFFAGALADRLPKRRLVMVSQSVLFAQALLLAVLVQFGHVQYWHVAVLALLYGVANTVDLPTRQAFIVEMVGRDDLMNAIALNSVMFNAARIVGPAAAGFGLLMATRGAGAVIGAVALAALGGGRPSVAAVAVPALVLSACTALLAALRSVPVAAPVLFVMGFCGILFMAGSNSTVQLTVPDELRGRVMSLHTLVFAGSTPFGAFLIGSVAEAAGVTTALLVAGGGGLLSVLGLLLWWNGRDRGPSLAAPSPEGERA